ncbi:UNVERIFIED_CONTAM: hypothetical protein K2H54_032395 [Gekko kuhli]
MGKLSCLETGAGQSLQSTAEGPDPCHTWGLSLVKQFHTNQNTVLDEGWNASDTGFATSLSKLTHVLQAESTFMKPVLRKDLSFVHRWLMSPHCQTVCNNHTGACVHLRSM